MMMYAKHKIYEILSKDSDGMTTREIAEKGKFKNLNTVKAMITLLKKMGLVENGPKRDCKCNGYWSPVYLVKTKASVENA